MIGRTFLGRYEVLRQIGEGGMGRVYLARQTDLGRPVVVKVMHDHIAADAKFRDRFQRETLLMARFHHPYAVTLYDASLNDPAGSCIVMEYVKGGNLEALLEKAKKMTAPRVGRIVGQLCEVLQAAHDEGIIHRDLKPANLMVIDADTPRERIKVMDFGLAKTLEEGTARQVTDTTVDFAVGTPAYICPEQIRGETMDHRGDLYSVAIIAFELLSGRVPFRGASGMDVLLAHATEEPPTFQELGLGGWVPAGVEAVVRKGLSKDPGDRYQSARELAQAFETALKQAKSDSRHRQSGLADGPPPDDGDESENAILLERETAPAGLEGVPPPDSKPSFHARPEAEARRSLALPFNMDAWMPGSIALMKLRGFVQDYGGEVLESSTRLVRVRLHRARGGDTGAWFRFSRRSAGPVELELQLHCPDPKQPNKLSIHVLFHPSHAWLLGDKPWRERCADIFIDLRAYLMGGNMT